MTSYTLFFCRQVKAEARLNKLREGGINVDEYIDAFVYAAAQQQQQQAAVAQVEQQEGWSENASETAEQVSTELYTRLFFEHPRK